jgi:hypothetical protein
VIYFYVCTKKSCANKQEEEHLVEGFKEFRPKCDKCGSDCEYKWFPTIIQFALIDGPSGTAPSKAERIKDYRRKQYEIVGKRQKDRYGHLNRDAVSNIDGQITESWREAQSIALKEKGKRSAATYEPKVQAEKKKRVRT